jgi:hypothetical protein
LKSECPTREGARAAATAAKAKTHAIRSITPSHPLISAETAITLPPHVMSRAIYSVHRRKLAIGRARNHAVAREARPCTRTNIEQTFKKCKKNNVERG